MISVYLCEDDKRQLEQYSRLIHRFLDFEGYEEMPVYEFRDPHALLNAAEKNGGTGLYFLDIQLNSDINGLELARQIRLLDPSGYIIFLTTHSEMMALTFQYHVEALDFITKDDPKLLEQKRRTPGYRLTQGISYSPWSPFHPVPHLVSGKHGSCFLFLRKAETACYGQSGCLPGGSPLPAADYQTLCRKASALKDGIIQTPASSSSL